MHRETYEDWENGQGRGISTISACRKVLAGAVDGDGEGTQATRPGLEPGMAEPKSAVLPLHHRAVLPHCMYIPAGYLREVRCNELLEFQASGSLPNTL